MAVCQRHEKHNLGGPSPKPAGLSYILTSCSHCSLRNFMIGTPRMCIVQAPTVLLTGQIRCLWFHSRCITHIGQQAANSQQVARLIPPAVHRPMSPALVSAWSVG